MMQNHVKTIFYEAKITIKKDPYLTSLCWFGVGWVVMMVTAMADPGQRGRLGVFLGTLSVMTVTVCHGGPLMTGHQDLLTFFSTFAVYIGQVGWPICDPAHDPFQS